MWSSVTLFQGKAEIKKAQLRSAPQPTAKPSAVVWESLGPEHRGGRFGGGGLQALVSHRSFGYGWEPANLTLATLGLGTPSREGALPCM